MGDGGALVLPSPLLGREAGGEGARAAARTAPSRNLPVRLAAHQADDAGAEPREAENEDQNGADEHPAALPAPMPSALPDEPGDAPGNAVPAGPLTLEEAEAAALASNPTLVGAAAAVEKARGLFVQVGLRPNPTVGVHADDVGEDGEAGRYGVFASQTFVTGDKLELSRAVESWEVRGLELRAEAQRLRVLTDVRRRFASVLAAQRRAEIAAELVTLARAGVELAEDLLEAGEVARPDVLQARVQLGEVRIARRDAEIARDAAWRSLTAVTGTPARPVGVAAGELEADDPPKDYEELWVEIAAASPELAAARARIARAKAALCRQQAQPTPNVTAQASLAYGVGGDDPIGGFQVGLPLPIRNDNRGNIGAALADVRRAAADLARLELDLRDRLAAALRARRGAENRLARLTEEVLPAARENLELSVRGYRQGEFDAVRVVTARRSLFEAELARVDALAARRRAAALIDGLLLSGALAEFPDAGGANLQGVGLRDQALGGQ